MHGDCDIVVIGGGHAGAEAAWAASRLGAATLLITLDPSRIAQMSCNPAIGGLAKGQMVREVDALGGLMGIATDNTGIQFRMLNRSKGPAVWGPRAQADKYRYAREVQRLLATCGNLRIIAGEVAEILTKIAGGQQRITGVALADRTMLGCRAVIVTTGTFLRGLMHTGETKTEGGRVGEAAARGLSGSLARLGLELGRLKTGTPPRLHRDSIDFSHLELQPGDDDPAPFSYLNEYGGVPPVPPVPPPAERSASDGGVAHRFSDGGAIGQTAALGEPIAPPLLKQWATPGREDREGVGMVTGVRSTWRPALPQVNCWLTETNPAIHEIIRANLHRAPMYSGQIQSTGPRYCPSIEDKVVRFADKRQHHIFLEPEGLDTDEIYCNGISTSLPRDVQEQIVHLVPGLQNARILRYGYAVEYDMVWPTQIRSTLETKSISGLFLAGQINGTSGYEEAAAQGLVAGINAARQLTSGSGDFVLRRDQAYIGVLVDDLVTKPPTEPYRMFTSRAEHRLHLRNDNADERLTEIGRSVGLVDDDRWARFTARRQQVLASMQLLELSRVEGQSAAGWLKRPEADWSQLAGIVPELRSIPADVGRLVEIRAKYEGYIARQDRQIERFAQLENHLIPPTVDYSAVIGLRNEARQKLKKFTPRSLGQALRISGITPADVTVLAVHLGRKREVTE